jgi:hypothetical protein
MKTLLMTLALALTTWTTAALADAPQAPREVMVGINEAYIPGGFDSTSDAYVVVSGIYNNGCYRWSRAEVLAVNAHEHEVRTFATVSPGMCLMVLVPYQREVRLGTLDSGKHVVRFVNGDGTYLEKSFSIE